MAGNETQTQDAAPADETAAPAATDTAQPPAAEAAAPEGNPPLVDGIIRLRAPDGNLYDYSIDAFSEPAAKEVYTLLPAHWQSKIQAQAAFFQNYEATVTGIPEELREPGAFEKLFATMRQQGGYLGDETSPAVRAFLDGPNGAGLRESSLYKGYKAADAMGDLLASGAKIVGAVPGQYFDALLLPVRGLAYAGGWMGDKLAAMPTITPEKALTLATAYQGMMYMATESEFAPKETKTSEPGAAGTAVGGIQSGFNYIMVAGASAWNWIAGWITGKKVTWDEAWASAENWWTEGKGLKSAAETAQTNAVAKSLEEVRPAVEERLRQTTIDGMDITPYLGVKEGDLVAGKDGKVSTFTGQDNPTKTVIGPDGKTALTVDQINQSNLENVTGGLGKDRTGTGLTATGLALGGATVTYKGIGQGFSRTMLDNGSGKIATALKGANATLTAAETKLTAFDNDVDNGKTPTNWRGKPLDRAVLDTAVNDATKARDNLAKQLSNLSTDPIGDAKASPSKFKQGLGNLAEGANHKLAADATLWDRAVNRVTAFGRGPGALVGHVSKAGGNFVSGVTTGTAQAISPSGTGALTIGKTGEKAADIITHVAEHQPVSGWGKFGKAVGFGGTFLSGAGSFISPILGIAESKDAISTGTYATEGAGIAAATWAAGGKEFGLKALGVGARRIVPGVGMVVDVVDYADGTRTGNEQKKRDAAVSAATQGVGAFIGGAIGLLGFAGGPLGAATVPAGMAIGTTIGGFASIVTKPLANRIWPVKAEASSPSAPSAPSTFFGLFSAAAAAPAPAQRLTQPPRVAAVVDARQSIANLELTQEELNAILESRMAVSRAGTSKAGFNAQAFARVKDAHHGGNLSGNVGGGNGQRPTVHLNV